MIPLHEDAMQVETQMIASFSNTASVPVLNLPVEHVEVIDEAATTISAAGSVEVPMDDNDGTYSM